MYVYKVYEQKYMYSEKPDSNILYLICLKKIVSNQTPINIIQQEIEG